MIKKLLVIIGLLLIIEYGGYLQYKVISSDNKLHNISTKKEVINEKYDILKKEMESKRHHLTDNNNKKVELENNIKTKTEQLTKTNDEINKKMEAIKQHAINNTGTKIAYLTFDDGPSDYTSKVLNILKEYGIKATFFVTGRSDEYSFSIYRRIVNEGHSIGNHTYSHSYQRVYASVDAFDNNFNLLQGLIKDVTGVTMNIMRFPGGSNNTVSNKYSNGIMDVLTAKYKSLGYTYFDWNVSAGDGAASGVTTTSVINNIVNGCKNRKTAIILMHDSHKTTSDAIENIIISLSNAGFKFLPLTSSSYTVQFM